MVVKNSSANVSFYLHRLLRGATSEAMPALQGKAMVLRATSTTSGTADSSCNHSGIQLLLHMALEVGRHIQELNIHHASSATSRTPIVLIALFAVRTSAFKKDVTSMVTEALPRGGLVGEVDQT